MSPDKTGIPAGTYQAFSATVSGLEEQTVTWTVENGPSEASVDDAGVFTAHRSGTYRVFASSTVDPSLNWSSVIKVVSSVTSLENKPADLGARGYSVTALKDGRVLIVGGRDASGGISGVGHLYDPESKTFQTVPNQAVGCANHTATLLDDGRVLIAGGFTPRFENWGPDNYARQALVFNPASGLFEELPMPTTGCPDPKNGLMRGSHTYGSAAKLGSGKVLLVGDDYYRTVNCMFRTTSYSDFRRSDLFDPSTSTFDVSNWTSDPLGSMWVLGPNCFPTYLGQKTVTLEDGSALITGGHIPAVADPIDSCTGEAKEMYGTHCGAYPYTSCIKSSSKRFTDAGAADISSMTRPRSFHTMTKLADGRVLITGGYDASTFTAQPAQADSVTNVFEPHQ